MSADKRRRYSQAEIDEAVRDYSLGESADDIAVSLGAHPGTIRQWVRAAGVRVRSKGPGDNYMERRREML